MSAKVTNNKLDIFLREGNFLMLAFDHRGSFKKYVNPDDPENVTDEQLIAAKKEIIEAVQDDMTGILIDPDWGLPAFAKAVAGKPSLEKKPYLMCLEKSGYKEEGEDKTAVLEYKASDLVNWGASGAKLLIYLNPAGKNIEKQVETTRQALLDCRAAGLPFFLEFVTYGNEKVGEKRGEWVKKSVQIFLDAGVVPDVFKLEYPGSEEDCRKITKMLGDTPWILLTRGEKFDIFKEQLRTATKAGAVGFLAGRAVWQEYSEFKGDLVGKKKFLQETVKNRFREICDVVLGKNSQ